MRVDSGHQPAMLIDEGELLTCSSHGGSVDQRHQIGGVFINETEEETAITIVDAKQMLVFIEIIGNTLQSLHVNTFLEGRAAVH